LVGRGRVAEQQPSERLVADHDRNIVSVPTHGVDDRVDRFGEIVSALPVGEQVDVAAQPMAHAVHADRVSAGQRESELGCGIERELGDPAVARIHR